MKLYLPVFAGIEYRLARPLENYRELLVDATRQRIGPECHHTNVCILHYAHASLNGQNLGDFQANIVFGEIAYVVHNQTVVLLRFENR